MKKLPFRLLGLAALLGAGVASRPALAQTVYTPMRITSGYNADVIADNNGVTGGRNSVASTTTYTVDRGNATVRFCFADSSYINPAGLRPVGTLPTIIRSISTAGLVYRRAPSHAPGGGTNNNCLRIDQQNPQQLSGTLVFQTPTPCQIIKVLATEGNGSNPPQADKIFTLNFTDGTSQASTGIIVPDWFDTNQNAVTVFAYHVGSRVNYSNDGIEDPGNNPTLFEVNIPISAANTGKLVQSIGVRKVQQTGETNTQFTDPVLNVMGVSVVQSCIPPTSIASVDNTTICPGASATLTAVLTGGTPNVPGQWQSAIGGGAAPTFTNIAGATALTLMVSPIVTTQYRYRSACAGGAVAVSNSVTITVGIPGATLAYSATAYCRAGTSGAPVVSPAGGTFTSTPDGLTLDANGAIDLETATPGSYIISYTSPLPCRSQVNASVFIRSAPVFPNVITPNGDGKNDGLVLSLDNPDVSDFKLEVYSRWGSRIWQGTNPSVGWAAEKAGPGQYFYVVDYKDCTGKLQHFKGVVEVIK